MRTIATMILKFAGEALRVCFAIAAAVATTALADPATDSKLERAFVGTWSAEGPGTSRGATSYFADRTFEMKFYSDPSCTNVEHDASGIWLIKDGNLYTETRKSVGKYTRLRVGTRTRDKVVSVTNESMSLIDSDGNPARRIKGSPC